MLEPRRSPVSPLTICGNWVGTGVFSALTDRPLALMQAIANDQNMRPADRTVAKVLLAALNPQVGTHETIAAGNLPQKRSKPQHGAEFTQASG